MAHKIFFFTILLLWQTGALVAQISEHPIGHLQQVDKSTQRKSVVTDTLNLPFWDDFSSSVNTVDTSLWQYGLDIFVNNTQAYLPPSFNVATFDGYDGNGTAYSTNSQARGIGDSLISMPIDLSSYSETSNVYLSFFWQEKHGEQAPDSQDSLLLSFRNSDNQWERVFKQGGQGLSSPTLFQQVFVAVNEERFLHSGFQFKFELLSNLAGDFDVFNVDYIYLNEGNTPVNTQNHAYDSYEDRTFAKAPQSILGDYYAIPLSHLNEDWLLDNLQETNFIYNNLWAGNANNPLFGTEIFGTLTDSLKPVFIIDSLQINGNFLTQNQDTALFTAQSRQPQKLIDHLLQEAETEDSVYLKLSLNLGTNDSLFFETINGVKEYYPNLSFRANDTISIVYPLHNFYAQDDGTAESSIRLNSKNYQLAQEFNILGEHYMTAIDMYIPNSAQNVGTRNITLLVWTQLTNDPNDIKLAQNVLVNEAQGINNFQRFEFEQPLFIGGQIYIGYREENDDVISVGFDKNSNSATDLFYNQSGSWEPNTLLEGSIMIRPVFDDISDVVSNKKPTEFPIARIYPNPNRGQLFVDQAFDQLTIFGSDGRIHLDILSKNNRNEPIDISNLKNGLYLVRILNNGNVQTSKLLLRK
ncbi:T9SS type A sorting domain-containing protein [Marivirga sp. S37H4]|uniref:T9SS type A sorting domain-containing protein n=1 Tax=Marivirga aurantiaca TaxID=2802615 RepID=A0A934WY05_9BACT|nr:T9SS type A sorting domain-containing protein [Marivirga aurantiaca]MBK6264875.1 T9SS type A sorting domain-containing protein [Marivirga aurantiaca]